MRNILVLLIIVFSFFCICKPKKNENIENSYKIEKRLPLYFIDTCMYKLLAKVIDTEIGCPNYKKGNTCFYFSVEDYRDADDIHILSAYIKTYNYYSEFFGIFNFRNHKFLCEGNSKNINKFIHKSKTDSITLKYEINRDHLVMDNIDDSPKVYNSRWFFSYRNKKFILIEKEICTGHKGNSIR